VGQVFVATPRVGGLYISTDAGHTWTRVRGTLAEGVFPVIAADVGGTTVLAASATDGIYAIEFGAPVTSTAGDASDAAAPQQPNIARERKPAVVFPTLAQ